MLLVHAARMMDMHINLADVVEVSGGKLYTLVKDRPHVPMGDLLDRISVQANLLRK
jgi:hypothetical protein